MTLNTRAARIVYILDRLEEAGRFDGMTDDEKEIERQSIGMRLKRGMGMA